MPGDLSILQMLPCCCYVCRCPPHASCCPAVAASYPVLPAGCCHHPRWRVWETACAGLSGTPLLFSRCTLAALCVCASVRGDPRSPAFDVLGLGQAKHPACLYVYCIRWGNTQHTQAAAASSRKHGRREAVWLPALILLALTAQPAYSTPTDNSLTTVNWMWVVYPAGGATNACRREGGQKVHMGSVPGIQDMCVFSS